MGRPGTQRTREVTPGLFRRAVTGAGAAVSLLLLQAFSFDPTVIFDLLRTPKIQILLGIVIAFLLAMAVFAKKFPRFFEKVAVVLTTVLLVLLVLEVVSLCILSYSPGLAADIGAGADPVEAAQPGYDELHVTGGGGLIYAPFTVWAARRVNTVDLGTTDSGNRLTPGGDPRASYSVFAFGGSGMWGKGVPDSSTIAAFLQAGFDSMPGRPVIVENYGQIGWSSTQSLVRLVLELREGNVPDLVIFYDGTGDADAAYSEGRAGSHLCIQETAGRIEGAPSHSAAPAAGQLLESSSIYTLVAALSGSRPSGGEPSGGGHPALLEPLPEGVSAESLALDVEDCYFDNMDVVDALSRTYGFRYLFVWQPIASFGNKVLTQEEVGIVGAMSPALVDFCGILWQRMRMREGTRDGFVFLGDEFELDDERLYLDEGCLTPEGNRHVAAAILTALQEHSALAGR